ncbi:MAG: DUF6531 domain-containing protein [Kofleriaceae bacterium]|nr:DUF6531 domain-containing protein [Kofleriaceae bacterium]
MTLASSWMDLVVGVDIHLHLVPTPGGPVPTPIPQPFMGMVGDPVGAVVGAITGAVVSLVQSGQVQLPSGPVLINGLPATTTDGIGKNMLLLPHMPMPPGTAHVKKPNGEATLPLGVLKTTFGGVSGVPLAQIAISCGDPPLPTSKVVVIPKGPPVLLLGAPGIDVQAAVAKWAMGKVVRTAFRGVAKLAKRLAKLSGPRLRNLISKNRCTVAGHPVDVATGRVFTSAVDAELPGPLPFVFERNYFSSWAHRDGVLGPGWSHSYDQAVWVENGVVVYRNGEGQEIVFDFERDPQKIERGLETFDPFSRNTLVRTKQGWRIESPEGMVHHFSNVNEADAASHVARLTRITTRDLDVAIQLAYDEQGRLATLTDAAGRLIRLAYEGGRLAAVLLPDPGQANAWAPYVTYRYAQDGTLTAAVDAAGRATEYEYDGSLMVRETDRNGVSFFWIYDGGSSGARCVRTWGQSGDQIIYNQKLDYDPSGRQTLVTDSYNNKTLYRMNEAGAIVEVIDALGGTTQRTYDESLQLTAEVDPEGRTTKHQYGPRGQLVMTVLPDGAQRAWKHDPQRPELITAFRNEAGAVWRYQYDASGRLIETRGPEADAHAAYAWDRGRLRAVSESGGVTEVTERDGHGNPTCVRLPTGGLVRRSFDRLGRLVTVTNPYGGVESYSYDVCSRLVLVSQADGAQRRFHYDPEGNLLEMFDGRRRTRCTYAGWNRLASRTEGESGATVRFIWGAEGELREIRNEKNHEYRFDYDPCLRVEREMGFDLQETRYKRDKSGWVTKIAKPKAGVHTDVRLDALGRVVERKNSDRTFAKFIYRPDGELLEATNQTTTVRFERDALGRVTKEVQGDVEVMSFYAGGYRARLESTLGAGLGIGRDSLGNPVSYSTALEDRGWTDASRVAYDVAGAELRRELPGGTSVEWRRDQAGRPLHHFAARAGGMEWHRSYSWSADDAIGAIQDSRFGLTQYAHDDRGRLIAAKAASGEVVHRAFDEVGNVYRTPDRTDRRYVRGGILRNDGDVTFAFDLLGNLRERHEPRGTWHYDWDGDGMLTKVRRPDGSDVHFTYDALGRRVSKRAGERETRWVWDGDVILHELRTGAETVTWYHEPESFTPIMRVEGRRVRQHIVGDHLGTPSALYDDVGKLAWQMQLDLFGVPKQVGEADVPFRWPGQHEDKETGLLYNRFRYYDPGVGSYVSQDPLGLLGGFGAYAYVANPNRAIDPWGLLEVDPWSVNFSQRTVGPEVHSYTKAMREGQWDWNRSGPLRVMQVGDQYVSYDNRRLMAAQNAGLKKVPIVVVDPDSTMPGSKSRWADKFKSRRHKAMNLLNGMPVPPEGLKQQPKVEC